MFFIPEHNGIMSEPGERFGLAFLLFTLLSVYVKIVGMKSR